jgi:hypothetical protein
LIFSTYKKVKPDNGRAVVAYGEVTGHHHSISLADYPHTELYKKEEDNTSKFVLAVKETTTLVHQEHAPITLTPGIYIGAIQTEYDPEGERRVLD